MASLVSEQALAAVTERVVADTRSLKAPALVALADDLAAVDGLLSGDVTLRRAVSDVTVPADARSALARRLLSERIGAAALQVVIDAVERRWGSGRDLADSLVSLSRTVRFIIAENAGELDTVEEELFRFGRLLDANPQLGLALDDARAAAGARAALVHRLLDGKVLALTAALLAELAADARGRSYAHGVAELVAQAAARRGKLVAEVTAPAPLTAAETDRLAAALERIYARGVTVHVAVSPSLQGGLRVRVGDEVIDGSVSGRLTDLRARLARRA